MVNKFSCLHVIYKELKKTTPCILRNFEKPAFLSFTKSSSLDTPACEVIVIAVRAVRRFILDICRNHTIPEGFKPKS